jgi:hypothetical protein
MPRPAALAALAALVTTSLAVALALPACKDGNSDTTQVAALARELQAFGQLGDIPASAAHRDWLLEHIGWDELIGVFIADALSQLEPERREQAMASFLIDVRTPTDTTMDRRKLSLTRLTVALGNNKCKVIKAGAEDRAWAEKAVSAPAQTEGLSPENVQVVTDLRARVAKLSHFYTIDCGRKMVHIVVAPLDKEHVLPMIRDMKGGGPATATPGSGPPDAPGPDPDPDLGPDPALGGGGGIPGPHGLQPPHHHPGSSDAAVSP